MAVNLGVQASDLRALGFDGLQTRGIVDLAALEVAAQVGEFGGP